MPEALPVVDDQVEGPGRSLAVQAVDGLAARCLQRVRRADLAGRLVRACGVDRPVLLPHEPEPAVGSGRDVRVLVAIRLDDDLRFRRVDLPQRQRLEGRVALSVEEVDAACTDAPRERGPVARIDRALPRHGSLREPPATLRSARTDRVHVEPGRRALVRVESDPRLPARRVHRDLGVYRQHPVCGIFPSGVPLDPVVEAEPGSPRPRRDRRPSFARPAPATPVA